MGVGHPPLAPFDGAQDMLREPQHERPRTGEGITLTPALSLDGRGSRTPPLIPGDGFRLEGRSDGVKGRGGEGEGNNDGRSYGLRQEGGYAYANANGVDDHPAAAPDIFEKVDEARKGLGVGLPRPPMALDDGEGGQPGAEAVIKHLEFADSYDGGVLGGLKALETDVSGLFRFAGEVDAGYVDSAWNGGTDSTVLATK